MRKIISLFLSILLMFSVIIPTQVNAEDPIKVYINGEIINFTIDPVVENGTTLVQFRPIFEKLGLSIGWDANTQTVTGEKEGLKIELIIGNKVAKVNGVEKSLNLAPKTIKGNTMIPLRFIGEASGEQVEWYGDSRTIQIGKQITVSDGNAFRNTKWGMSKESVKKVEDASYIWEGNNLIFYYDDLQHIDMNIFYEFIDNKLVHAGYVSNEDYSNKNSYITDYYYLKGILTKKYGEPTNDDTFWYNDLFKDDYYDWGLAISIGHLKYRTVWETSDTQIMMVLDGDSYDVKLTIMYLSKEYKDLYMNSKENQAIDDL